MTNLSALTREQTPIGIESGGIEVRMQEIGGGMTVSFIRLPAGADLGPVMAGLPDDLCQCPHWGYITKGRVGLRTKDGEEVYEAGQAFYWAPGHAPFAPEDAEYVELSPTSDFKVLIDHCKALVG